MGKEKINHMNSILGLFLNMDELKFKRGSPESLALHRARISLIRTHIWDDADYAKLMTLYNVDELREDTRFKDMVKKKLRKIW